MKNLIVNRIVIMLVALSMGALQTWAAIVTGTVIDDRDEPVIGAVVRLKSDAKVAALTDINGRYKIDIPDLKTGVLTFTSVGLVTREVKVNGRSVVNVKMEADMRDLNEVVVVGYGQQKKASVVGAITQTTGDVLERAAGISSVGAALTGNLPGVVTVTSSGQPGEEDPEITIRGAASWNNNASPLVLVDGIERPLTSVDITSVATVSVLKDASATAVYGVKGANGVILITTKRGEEGKAKISVGFNASMKAPSMLPGKYDSYDSYIYRNRAIEHELAITDDSWAYYRPMSFISNFRHQSHEVLPQYDKDGNFQGYYSQAERYPNVDWQKALFKDNAMAYNANLNVMGGTKHVKYFVAFDFVNEGDLTKIYDNHRGYKGGYSYNRLNVRSNLDFQVTPTTVFKVNLAGSNAIKKAPFANQGDIWQEQQRWAGAYNIAPNVFIPQYSDGSWGYYPDASNVSNSAQNTALAGLSETTNTRITTDFTLEQDLKFITPGLTARATISWDNIFTEGNRGINDLYNDSQIKFIRPETGQVLLKNEFDGYDGYDWSEKISWSTMGGDIWNTTRNLYYSAQLYWGRKFGDHNASAMGLFSRQENANNNMIPTYREDWVFRLTYDWKSRYFVEYNGAYNGSEKFSKENRFAFFNSGALGWMISEEPFMKWFREKNIIDMLKVRGSYGEIGSDASGDRWLYMTQWAYGGKSTMDLNQTESIYQWYREQAIGNPDIHWEVVRKKNIGVDYAFVGGLLAGSLDFFRDDRSDIFVSGSSRTVPSYFGGTAPSVNKGKIKTTGYELELRLNKVFRNHMRLWGNFNMTHAKNVIKVKDDAELLPSYRKEAGYAVGQYRTHIDNGFIANYDQLLGAPNRDANDAGMLVGDHYIVDFNGDGVVDNVNDQAPYAYTPTPQNTYNATIGFEWKGFSCFAQFYGVTNVTRDVTLTTFAGSQHLLTVYDTGDWFDASRGGGDVVIPRWNSQVSYNDGTQFLYDGSYVRLKNVEIAYTWTKGWVKKIGVSRLKLYANGNNLWLWTRMPDDREGNLGGFSGGGGAYPTVKRFNLGIKLDF